MGSISLMAACLVFALAKVATATMVCTTCIPLEDLLAPGYGISVSIDGLTSAAAHHNGTMAELSSMTGSDQFRHLLSTIFETHDSYEPRKVAMRCPARTWRHEHAKSGKTYLTALRSYTLNWVQKMTNIFAPEEIAFLDPNSQMLQAELLKLEPFASMDPNLLSQLSVAISIPAWVVPSPYACDLRQAAEATFGRVMMETAPSSAFTALGHELCRVSYDMFECDGPGVLVTLEYDGVRAVASAIKTPIDIFDRLNTKYSTITSQDSEELSKWINNFLESASPDMLALAGRSTNSETFRNALAMSIAGKIESGDGFVQAADIVVKGVAQVAKNDLENHDSDCIEDSECLDIRREADKLAGRYSFRRPKVWPAVDNRHWRDGEKEDHMPLLDDVYQFGIQLE